MSSEDESTDIFGLNTAIIDCLPSGLKLIEARPHAPSARARNKRLLGKTQSGEIKFFFVKEVHGPAAKTQVEAEFDGMKLIHSLVPRFAPEPYKKGKLKGEPVYFILMEFKPFVDGLPDPVKLGYHVSDMHLKSTSPTGKFGYFMTTYDGSRTQVVGWDPSWTSFFSKLLAEAYRHDIVSNGHWEDLDRVYERAQSHLIPRLIGAVESDGRSIKPSLIHGNMWDGNVRTDADSANPVAYDSAVYYGHHEMEAGIWRAERHELSEQVFRKEYMRRIKPSEPWAECCDRNLLYSIKTNFMHSACVRKSPARPLAYNNLVYLINKYVPWPNQPETKAEATLN